MGVKSLSVVCVHVGVRVRVRHVACGVGGISAVHVKLCGTFRLKPSRLEEHAADYDIPTWANESSRETEDTVDYFISLSDENRRNERPGGEREYRRTSGRDGEEEWRVREAGGGGGGKIGRPPKIEPGKQI